MPMKSAGTRIPFKLKRNNIRVHDDQVH
jgi:hypothetical protein